RAPTLVPLQNSLIRLFGGLTFYLLLPVAMLLFAWKAAVFLYWGLGLFCVAAAVIAWHVLLPVRGLSLLSRGLLIVGAAIIVGGILLPLGLPHRPFNLFRANLSGQWLVRLDLRGADLGRANLREATLLGSDLSGAQLDVADLRGVKNVNQAQLDQ